MAPPRGAIVQDSFAAGIPAKTALAALIPLLRGTIENVERLGPRRALTGPMARGDASTVARHAAALRGGPDGPALWACYAALGRRALALGRARGSCAPAAARAIDRLLGSNRR